MDLSGDASIGHGSIDKSQKLHDVVVEKIMKVAVGPARHKRSVPAKPKPVVVVPAAGSPAVAPARPASATPKPGAAPLINLPSAAAPIAAIPPVPAPSVAPPVAPSLGAPAVPPADTGTQVPRI